MNMRSSSRRRRSTSAGQPPAYHAAPRPAAPPPPREIPRGAEPDTGVDPYNTGTFRALKAAGLEPQDGQ